MNQLLCLILLCLSFNSHATKLRIVTEDLPPLQLNNHSKPATGAMVELVRLMVKEAKLEATIEVYPWARSYKIAQTEPNTLIFSMFRDASREKLFQWIGKIYAIDSYLVSLKTRQDINISSISNAKKYTVGSIRDDLAENYLISHGFIEKKNLYLSSAYPVLWKMLYNKRTDIAFTNSHTWQHEIERTGLDPNKIKIIYKIPDITSELYIAASLSTDKKIVTRLQAALVQIKSDGRYQHIIAKWQL